MGLVMCLATVSSLGTGRNCASGRFFAGIVLGFATVRPSGTRCDFASLYIRTILLCFLFAKIVGIFSRGFIASNIDFVTIYRSPLAIEQVRVKLFYFV